MGRQPVEDVFGWLLGAAAKAESEQILTEEIKDLAGLEFMAPPADADQAGSCTMISAASGSAISLQSEPLIG
jgi:hypothetical protein